MNGVMILGFFDPLIDKVSETAWTLVQTLFRIIYWIEEVFYILAGIKRIPGQPDNTDDLVTMFLKGMNGEISDIRQIFFAMALLAIVVFILCLCWGMLKAVFSKNPSEAGRKVLGNSFKALVFMILIPVIFFFGIWLFGSLMRIIVDIFNIKITGYTPDPSLSEAEQIMEMQRHSIAQEIFLKCFKFDLTEFSAEQITEFNKTAIFTNSYSTLESYGISMSITGGNFQYFVAVFVTLALGFSLCLAAVALSERIINIALLYVIAPFVLATCPLDDGKRLETWRDLMFSKVIGILGNVLSMNIFLLLLGFLGKALTPTPSMNWEIQMIINLIYFIVAISGAFMAFKGSQLIASIVSQASGTQEGFSQMTTAQLAQGAARLGAAGVKHFGSLFGGKNNPVSQQNKLSAGGNGGGVIPNGSGGGGNSGSGGSTAGSAGAGGQTFAQQMSNAAKGHGKVAMNSMGKVGKAAAIGGIAAALSPMAAGLIGMMAPALIAGGAFMAGRMVLRHAGGYGAIGAKAVGNKFRANKEAKQQLKGEGKLKEVTGTKAEQKAIKAENKKMIQERAAQNKELNRLQREADQGNLKSQVELTQLNDNIKMQERLDDLDKQLVAHSIEVNDGTRMHYADNGLKQYLSEKRNWDNDSSSQKDISSQQNKQPSNTNTEDNNSNNSKPNSSNAGGKM